MSLVFLFPSFLSFPLLRMNKIQIFLFPFLGRGNFTYICVFVVLHSHFEFRKRRGGFDVLFIFMFMFSSRLLSKHAEEARAGSVEVFRRFREGREEREMPGFERGEWCVALRVYWRKGRGDEEGREGEEGVEEMVRVMEGQRL